MKFMICLAVLAFAVAYISACESGGDNKPECCGTESNVTHGYDASAFWSCKEGEDEAVKEQCPDGKCFDGSSSECVSCEGFKWKPPCP